MGYSDTSIGRTPKNIQYARRIAQEGYKGGHPNILILSLHKIHNGMALEPKTPTGLGVLPTKQSPYLDTLKNNTNYTIVSGDYDELIL